MNLVIFWVLAFVVSFFVIELVFYSIKQFSSLGAKETLRRRLETASIETSEKSSIIKKVILSDIPLFNQLLSKTRGAQRLNGMLREANLSWSVGFFVLLIVVVALASFLFTSYITRNQALATVVAGVSPGLIFLYVGMKKAKRHAKFERQLPEALDLIGRALRAGHAFPSGMKLVADEFEEPLGMEFGETVKEINFGVSVPDALHSLARRVDSPELKYFVTSVVLQRETGGNLTEIIDSITRIIRERFKLKGKIKVLSAEGRFSALVLTALPFVSILFLHFQNPDYLTVLWTEPEGRLLGGIALCMMLSGLLVIKKMINIKV
jgi:tight adherence protein B